MSSIKGYRTEYLNFFSSNVIEDFLEQRAVHDTRAGVSIIEGVIFSDCRLIN